jgi:hypothetical protein
MKNYIKYLKRRSKHVQHIHAAVFAGSITFLIAVFILYSDYGFWHEKYRREEVSVEASLASSSTKESVPESPMDALSRFFSEAHTQFKGVTASSGSFLEGKETYSR